MTDAHPASSKTTAKEEEDILATCLHLYDVDIKDGERCMLIKPQPRLRTPTVFDGSTPTFPERARELRTNLEHINLLDFAYDAEDSLTTETMVQKTPARRRQHVKTVHLTQARRDLRDERATPEGDPARRDNAVINEDLQ